MTAAPLLPLLAAVVAAFAAGSIRRRLPPPLALRAVALLAAGAATAIVWGLVLVSIGYLASLPWVTERAPWCHVVFPFDHGVPPVAGLASLAALVAGCVGGVRAFRRMRIPRSMRSAASGVVIVPDPSVAAFTVPGRPGYIAVSEGVLDLLDDAAIRVVLAHEGAHLRHRHHRWTGLAGVAAGVVPILGRLAREAGFAAERWADEDAAAAVGSRRLVAETIARMASASGRTPSGAMAAADIGVVGRVAALLGEPPTRGMKTVVVAALGASGVLLSLAGSTVQLHHLLAFVVHVCQLS